MIYVAASSASKTNLTAADDASISADPNLRLMGYSVRENKAVAATAAGAVMHGATVAGGAPVSYFELAADSSADRWYGPDGIACPNGVSVAWDSGEFDIVLFYKKGEI